MGERVALPAMTGAVDALVLDERPRADLVRCGAELVALSERFYRGMFRLALIVVGLAALASLALVPFRQYPSGSGPSLGVVLAPSLLALATPLALWHGPQLYGLLVRRPQVQFAGVLVAAALVALIPPLNSALWWPSCAILMLLATLVSLRRAWFYCLVVLAANLAAHVANGDLHKTAPVAIIGLWIGYPFWATVFSVITDRMAGYLLQLNAIRAEPSSRPVRVAAWTTEASVSPAAEGEPGVASTPAKADVEVLDGLTARQLQVVALLADGLRYREIAACLAISERQVERHVANAVSRLGVRSVNQLVAAAVAARMVPNPSQFPTGR